MLFSTHMISEEVEDWWDNMRQRMKDKDTEVTWVVFNTIFVEKYFNRTCTIRKRPSSLD